MQRLPSGQGASVVSAVAQAAEDRDPYGLSRAMGGVRARRPDWDDVEAMRVATRQTQLPEPAINSLAVVSAAATCSSSLNSVRNIRQTPQARPSIEIT